MNLEDSFRRTWNSLAPIGRHPRSGGYRRFAWTEADLACRAWFVEQARARGMGVEQDGGGNLWAWTAGRGESGLPAVVAGSHLDSVPDGGAYDGPLGVVSAFLAIDLLRDRGVTPGRPLVIVAFAEEEGARFGVSCLGSRLLAGLLDPRAARELTDADGVTLAEAMRAAGADPEALGAGPERLANVGAFVELHIEQGRGLADLDAPVGTATAIWPHGRWRFDFTGSADHAGTTRLADRADPMLPFARTALAAREAAGRAGAVATFGRVRVEPNGTNAIPSTVRDWLDARAPDDAAVDRLVAEITAAAEGAAAEHGVAIAVTRESYTAAVDFDPSLRERVASAIAGHGMRAPALPTGAGHDAGILNSVVPSAMLFVRNPSGTSHSPAERAELADCLAGVRALATVLEELATDGVATGDASGGRARGAARDSGGESSAP